MSRRRRLASICFAILIAALAAPGMAGQENYRPINGTVWAANRGTHSIRGWNADTGEIVTIAMTPGSGPGDLAYAKGKLYVAEENGTVAVPPAIAILDAVTGESLKRIPMPVGSRPHHVHASAGGNLVAVGLYGTDTVAVVDTHTDTLLGPWDTNPNSSNGRAHAGVFAQDGNTLYVCSDASNEVIALDPLDGSILWRLEVPGAHEMVVTHDGKTAYVSRRTLDSVARIDLVAHDSYEDVLNIRLPDTLRLSANEKMLTVGLRTRPAQLAVADTGSLTDTGSFAVELVNLGLPNEPTTIGGHQWTSPSGRFTFASYEGGTAPSVAVIDHFDGNRVVQRLDFPGQPHGVTHALK